MLNKVLIIEDFPVVQELYGKYLNQNGYKVDIAEDGEEALRLTEKKDYDFIFVDLLLPNVNGIEFLENFKKKPSNARVFILSDFNEAETAQKAHELGAEKFLVKAENTPSQILKLLQAYKDKA